MKNPHFEKTQARNPHQLTIWQHIMPKTSIARFCDANGLVQLERIEQQQRLALKPSNEIFCAKRVWSQQSETTSIKDETTFQKVVDQILSGQISSLADDMHIVVTEMYLLWRTRFIHASNPIPAQQLKLEHKEKQLTKDEQERLEKAHIVYVQSDGTVSSRHFTSILIRRDMDAALTVGASKMKWGILKSLPGMEFLCPDASLNQPIIPVSPNVCLVAGWPDGAVTPFATGNINRTLLSEANNYWFARDPSKCPIIKTTSILHHTPIQPMI